jgi:hypothetical protein
MQAQWAKVPSLTNVIATRQIMRQCGDVVGSGAPPLCHVIACRTDVLELQHGSIQPGAQERGKCWRLGWRRHDAITGAGFDGDGSPPGAAGSRHFSDADAAATAPPASSFPRCVVPLTSRCPSAEAVHVQPVTPAKVPALLQSLQHPVGPGMQQWLVLFAVDQEPK